MKARPANTVRAPIRPPAADAPPPPAWVFEFARALARGLAAEEARNEQQSGTGR